MGKSFLGYLTIFVVTFLTIAGIAFLIYRGAEAEIEYSINWAESITDGVAYFFDLVAFIAVFLILWRVVRRIFFAISRLLESLSMLITQSIAFYRVVVIFLSVINAFGMIYLLWWMPVTYIFSIKIQAILYSIIALDESYVLIVGTEDKKPSSRAIRRY